jgi:hypothetical protein
MRYSEARLHCAGRWKQSPSSFVLYLKAALFLKITSSRGSALMVQLYK